MSSSLNNQNINTGYNKKPIWINILAAIYLLVPIGNISINAFANDITVIQCINMLYINSINLNIPSIFIVFISIASIVLAYGLFKVYSWSWHYFIIHSLLLVLINFISDDLIYGITIGIPSYGVMNLLLIIPFIPLAFILRKIARRPYLDSRIQWWKQFKRLREEIPIEYSISDKTISKTLTFDLSEGGVFIGCNNLVGKEVGDRIGLKSFFILNNRDKPFDITGEIVWFNEKPTIRPMGFGVKFLSIDSYQQKIIKNHILKVLKEDSSLGR